MEYHRNLAFFIKDENEMGNNSANSTGYSSECWFSVNVEVYGIGFDK